MSTIPLFLRADAGHRIAIIGGGAIALSKVEALLPYAAALTVVSPEFSPALRNLATTHAISLQQEVYTSAVLDGVTLVIAATDDKSVQDQIWQDAKAKGILVNAVDRLERCDVIFPAIVRRGDVQVAISSAGVSPVLARLVKQKIERILPWNLEWLADFAGKKRHLVKRAFRTIREKRLFWQEVLEGPVAEAVLEGNHTQAEQLFAEALDDAKQVVNRAALYLIGAGPGHPDLITVKATRLLSLADVVLYDRLTSPALLEQYTRREATRICVGKTRGHHAKSQSEIDELIAYHLKRGEVVVRLKGGDPAIYAHSAEEIAIARQLNVPYQIVPGISAANGCAAYAGIPLTERDGAQSVRILTVYGEHIHDEEYWRKLHLSPSETLVFYMSSHHRKLLCERLVKAGLPEQTPILAIEQGTTPSHREYEGTLADFGQHYQPTKGVPVLMIVGDVVRFRHAHGWKEQANYPQDVFHALPAQEVVHAIH